MSLAWIVLFKERYPPMPQTGHGHCCLRRWRNLSHDSSLEARASAGGPSLPGPGSGEGDTDFQAFARSVMVPGDFRDLSSPDLPLTSFYSLILGAFCLSVFIFYYISCGNVG